MGIESRIIAESPERGFTPWSGRIDKFGWTAATSEDLRVHTQVPTDEPYDIPTEFDPNLALGIIWGKDLADAKTRGVDFLNGLTLEGADASGNALESNIAFLRDKTADILIF